uniref:Globin family profile domain-containing protein n=1 Tax=Ditylenchus dipsaci TaxID=166011 RepID=A0A915D105_9BILA
MNPKKNSTASAAASANLLMPSLARLRIQQCFKNAKPIVGQHILKRACSLRSEIKVFLSYLTDEKVEELATDIYVFVTECVASLEEPERVSALSKAFGQMHAALCQMGFRPEFFSTIADATIAECVRLDGGAHKRCETLLAWSQLMQFMFSNVRDGYYAEIRQQRRSSLPQHRLMLSKQQSIDVRNNCCSFDMDL